MDSYYTKLTILFEPPFWVGIYERNDYGVYTACKITFGAETKDNEVYLYFLQNWKSLRFSPPSLALPCLEKKRNPKRVQREIHRQVQSQEIGTKAQQALQMQREQGKTERKSRGRLQKHAEQERLFSLRQAKKKEKHKGH